MFDEKTAELRRFVLALDCLLTVLVFIASFWSRTYYLLEDTADYYSHMALLPLILALLIITLSYYGAYQIGRNLNIWIYAWKIFRAWLLSIGMLLSLLFFLKIQYVSRHIILVFAILEFFTLLGTRAMVLWYTKRAIKKGDYSLRVLLIGTGERARELSEKLRKQTAWGVQVVGHLDPDCTRAGRKILDSEVIGTICDISKCLKEHVIDEVIIAIPRSMLNDVEMIYQACEEEGIKLRFMADVFNLQVDRMRLIQIGAIPLLTLEPVALDDFKLIIKRFLDLTLTLAAMPIILPLMAVVAIAIKLDSPGPVFFIQQRVGLRKHLFPLLKFRSMYEDAEQRLEEIEHLNEADGPIFKITNDPRVTRVGRFIRRTSIDELPQLFNVIMGHMSLVGPRPMSIRDVDLFDKGIQRKRFSVKPGITCLWQVSGRSNLPFSKWLELDLNYIENWTLFLDLKIILKTIPAVLLSKGAA